MQIDARTQTAAWLVAALAAAGCQANADPQTSSLPAPTTFVQALQAAPAEPVDPPAGRREVEPIPVDRGPVYVRLLWGQIPGSPFDGDAGRLMEAADAMRLRAAADVEVHPIPQPLPTRWAGSAVGSGVRVEVVGPVRFERGDIIKGCRANADAPIRARCRVAEWKTQTTTSHDGVLLRFTRTRRVRAQVVFSLGPFQDVPIPFDDLDTLDGLLEVGDRAGNLISVASVAPAAGCAAGFIEGVWQGSAANQGGFAGLWSDVHGTLGGWLQGVFQPGPLAYAAVRDLDGDIVAFIDGTYGAGRFEMTGRSLLGVPIADLWGHYGAGFYHGAFAVDCESPQPQPRPLPAEPLRPLAR